MKRSALIVPMLTGLLLAGCSTSATVEPATVATQPQRQIGIDASDVFTARTLRVGARHFTYSTIRNPFGKLLHHDAPPGYPLDMHDYGGPTMKSTQAYNVYVNCKDESCWGHPEEFLKGLAGSTLAGLITQYTGGAASDYQYKDSISVKYSHPYSNTYYNQDLFTVLSAAVRHFKATGLGVEYHIFLPKGVDTCFDQQAVCYSPDNLASEYFCAYHAYATGPGGLVIVYSVEPYQNVKVPYRGKMVWLCTDNHLPKGAVRLDNSTASTLSHESFESWSDPELNAWYNNPYQAEIGDICAYAFMTTQTLGGEKYYIQQEYSNAYHGCADRP